MIIALKGAIGTGKTTTSNIFKEAGYTVINADEIVHQMYQENTELIKEINLQFSLGQEKPGKGLLSKIKKRKIEPVDRKKLGAIVFNNQEELLKLESIVHPYLKNEILKDLENQEKVVIDCQVIDKIKIDYDIALLLHAKRETIIERVTNRDGKSVELVEQILKQQLKNEVLDKKTYAISSDGGIESIKKQIGQIKELKKNG